MATSRSDVQAAERRRHVDVEDLLRRTLRALERREADRRATNATATATPRAASSQSPIARTATAAARGGAVDGSRCVPVIPRTCTGTPACTPTTNTMSNAEQHPQPRPGLADRPAGEQPRRRLRRGHHDRHEERQRQHRQQQLGQPRVHRHRAEQRPHGHEPDGREHRDARERPARRRRAAGCRTARRAGIAIACTPSTNTRFASALPRKIASRSTGAPSRPSIARSACSTPNERCSPSSPEKVKITHSTPGARSIAATAVGSHAK